MSLCCFPFFRGSGQKKSQAGRCFCWCRKKRKRHDQYTSPSGRRLPQRSIEDVVEELADRFTYAINGYKGQVRQARKTVQCQTESSQEDIMEVLAQGPDYTTYVVRVQVHQADNTVLCLSEFAAGEIGNLAESCRMQALHEGTLEQVATSMVPAFPGENVPHVSTLAFGRAQQFLEELLARSCPASIRADAIKVLSTSGGTSPHKDRGDTVQDQVLKAIASMVGTWLDHVHGFGQPLPFILLEAEQALVPINSAASHLSSQEDIMEVLAQGPDYTTYGIRVQVHQSDYTVRCLSEFAAGEIGNLAESCRMQALHEGTLEQVATSMVPAFPGENVPHVSILAFGRAQQFLEELLARSCPASIRADAIKVLSTSGGTSPHKDRGDTVQDQVLKAIASMVVTWLDHVHGFAQPLPFILLEAEQALVPINSAASHLSSQEDIMEVMAQGPDYTTYGIRVQVHQSDYRVRCLSEFAAGEIGNLAESCRMQALHEGTLEQVATSMVPAFPGENVPHVSTLAFGRAQQFLEELLERSCPASIRADAIKVLSTSGGTSPHKDRGDTVQDQVLKAIASMVGTWLDHVHGFGQPLPFILLEAEQALVPINSAVSHLSSQEDIMEVLAQGPDYTTYWIRVQVHQSDYTVRCLSEFTAGEIGNLAESCRMQALREGTLEQVATSMVPAFPGENVPHVSTLAFGRAQQFLEELLARSCPASIRADAIKVLSTSGGTSPHKDRGDTVQDQVLKAIASMVGTWLDHVQGFGQPLPFILLEAEQALVPINSAASHLVARDQNLELEHLEPTGATRKGPHPELQSSPEPEEGPAQGPEPGPARGPTLARPGLRQNLKPLWSPLLVVPDAFSAAVLRVLGDFIFNN